jgi:hypothetical protein
MANNRDDSGSNSQDRHLYVCIRPSQSTERQIHILVCEGRGRQALLPIHPTSQFVALVLVNLHAQ